MLYQRKFTKRQRLTRFEKQQEELKWKKINEDIELKLEGVEPLLDSFVFYSIEIVGNTLAPIMSIFLIIFKQTKILESYEIQPNELGYYTIFSVYMIPWSSFIGVFTLNANELVHGWRIYDYLAYQRYRFRSRKHRWILGSEAFDESISETMQTLDLLCFSSQYYFILSLFALGVTSILFAVTIFLRFNYNVLGDPMMPIIVVIVFIVCDLVRFLMHKISDIEFQFFGWNGLWVSKTLEGVVDDDIAAKLAIGEGRQADLEEERLELQAMNNDSFRHRFLNRNRPWLLQHLVELLTPHSMEALGPTGRRVSEYIRDVHADLLAMGEGAHKAGDRSDISSDDDDEDMAKRRDWSRSPLVGANLAIAQCWLKKARKRRVFGLLVEGYIQNQKQDKCSTCSRDEKMCTSLRVGLARDGLFDPYAIDYIIEKFDERYSKTENDPNLWKSFFRSNAEFSTICNVCTNRIERNKLNRDIRFPGQGRLTRPDDISSDEDEEELRFDPLIINRFSDEGKMMCKWLESARKRMGGEFPRPIAKEQVDQYVNRMRQKKLKGVPNYKNQASLISNAVKDTEEEERKDFNWGELKLSNTSKTLALRWISLARVNAFRLFLEKGDEIRSLLRSSLNSMNLEDDWYFGQTFRMDGENLSQEGYILSQNRINREADETVQVQNVASERDNFEQEITEKINSKKIIMEAHISENAEKANKQMELRCQELHKNSENIKLKIQEEERREREEEGAISSEMATLHKETMQEADALIRVEVEKHEYELQNKNVARKKVFAQEEAVLLRSIEDQNRQSQMNISNIQRMNRSSVQSSEREWRGRTATWLHTATRKVRLKAEEEKKQQQKTGLAKRRGFKKNL